MKKLLNTLYVTTPDTYLSKDGTNVVVSQANVELFRVPVSNLESICAFGYQGASPGLMKLCAENGVALSFFTPNGRFVARVQGHVNGNVLLRKRQYERLSDTGFRLGLSSLFVFGKVFNSRVTLRRFVRDYGERQDVGFVEMCAEKLRRRCFSVRKVADSETLRGLEGECASIYYDAFPHLILNKDSGFSFTIRNRRPPLDRVNAMLSMGYSLLANDCASALEGVGLDPAAGFMHVLRPGRNSLALDLMEELRSYVVDRLVLSMINTRQIGATDFKEYVDNKSDGLFPVMFTDNGLKKFLSAWQTKKRNVITHPFLNEKIQLGVLPHVQALLLARYLRGDLSDYPVFIAK